MLNYFILRSRCTQVTDNALSQNSSADQSVSEAAGLTHLDAAFLSENFVVHGIDQDTSLGRPRQKSSSGACESSSVGKIARAPCVRSSALPLSCSPGARVSLASNSDASKQLTRRRSTSDHHAAFRRTAERRSSIEMRSFVGSPRGSSPHLQTARTARTARTAGSLARRPAGMLDLKTWRRYCEPGWKIAISRQAWPRAAPRRQGSCRYTAKLCSDSACGSSTIRHSPTM